DRYGHLVGDEVLRRVARCLQEVGNLVARRGGDEFVVVVRGEVDLAGLAARVRQVVAAVPLRDLCPAWTPACRIGSVAGVPERLGQDLMSVADRELVAQKATR